MKKILCFLLLIGLISACNEDPLDNSPLSKEEYVFLNTSSASVLEGATYTAKIYRATGDLSGTVTVGYTIAASYNSDSNFANAGANASGDFDLSGATGSVTIASGQASADIVIVATDETFASGNKTVTITLTSVSDSRFSVGRTLGATKNIVSNILVQDNDCPLNLTGNFQVAVDDWADYAVGDAIEVVQGPANNIFHILSTANPFIANPTTSWMIVTVNEADGTATVASNEPFDYGVPVNVSGTGTFSSCDETFTLSLNFTRPSDGAAYAQDQAFVLTR